MGGFKNVNSVNRILLLESEFTLTLVLRTRQQCVGITLAKRHTGAAGAGASGASLWIFAHPLAPARAEGAKPAFLAFSEHNNTKPRAAVF